MESIPVLDLKSLGNGAVLCEDDVKSVGKEIYRAFKAIGFAYVKNHGISDKLTQDLFASARKFYSLPLETKKKYERFVKTKWNGYMPMGSEHLSMDDGGAVAELKETFNARHFSEDMPEKEAPDFCEDLSKWAQEMKQLSLRLLRALEEAANRPGDLTSIHMNQLEKAGLAEVRVAYYPVIKITDKWPPEGALRCSQHSDWLTITLLMQDDVGGLEVKNSAGNWVSAPNIPGALLVNIGDLMEIWSGGDLHASKHRVTFDRSTADRDRISLVFFCGPPPDAIVSPPKDAPNGYTAVNVGDYALEKAERMQGATPRKTK